MKKGFFLALVCQWLTFHEISWLFACIATGLCHKSSTHQPCRAPTHSWEMSTCSSLPGTTADTVTGLDGRVQPVSRISWLQSWSLIVLQHVCAWGECRCSGYNLLWVFKALLDDNILDHFQALTYSDVKLSPMIHFILSPKKISPVSFQVYDYNPVTIYITFTFTFSHLADAFIQSDVQGREIKLRAIQT